MELRETTQENSRSAFNHSRRIWCHSPPSEYAPPRKQFELAARTICLVRPVIDVIILPGNHKPTREMFDFCVEVLGINEDQAIWTTGDQYHMHDDMDENVLSQIVAYMNRTTSQVGAPQNSNVDPTEWVVVPYRPCEKLYAWVERLARHPESNAHISTFAEDAEWVDKYGNKALLHRHVAKPDVPAVIELVSPDQSLFVPRGYVCSSREDLKWAYKTLTDECGDVILKPVAGAGGRGIVFRPNMDLLCDYDFPDGDVALEELLAVDHTDTGEDISPSLQYVCGELVDDVFMEQIMEGPKVMGWQRSQQSDKFHTQARQILTDLVNHAEPRAAGGVDFVSVNGKPFLTDLNTGRFTACHPPKMFRALHAPRAAEMLVWMDDSPTDFETVRELYDRWAEAGLAYVPKDPSRPGVFPLMYVRGVVAMYVAFGTSREHVWELRDRCSEIHNI